MLGEQKGDGAGHLGGGHRRALEERILVPGPGREHTGDAASTLLAVVDAVVAAGGDQTPFGPAQRAGIEGDLALGPGGAHDQGVEVRGVALGAGPQEPIRVARRQNRNGARVPRILDRVEEGLVAQECGEQAAVAQAEVDDLGSVLHDPVDAVCHVRRAATAAVVQHLGHHELGARRHSCDADAVVLVRGGDAGHMGAVAVVVLAVAGAGAVHARRALDDLANQVLVADVDSRVDDADLHPRAGGAGPGTGRPDLGEVPLLREAGVVRRPRAGRAEQGDDGRQQQCERDGAEPHASMVARN